MFWQLKMRERDVHEYLLKGRTFDHSELGWYIHQNHGISGMEVQSIQRDVTLALLRVEYSSVGTCLVIIDRGRFMHSHGYH